MISEEQQNLAFIFKSPSEVNEQMKSAWKLLIKAYSLQQACIGKNIELWVLLL